MTEFFDGIACLDERVRRQATPARPTEAGRYVEVQGPGEQLLIPLGGGADPHRSRSGLAADLRLDEDSVYAPPRDPRPAPNSELTHTRRPQL